MSSPSTVSSQEGTAEGEGAVLVTWPFEPDQVERMQEAATPLPLRYVSCPGTEEVAQHLDESVEVLYAYYVPSDVSKARHLRWVQLHSAGIDQLRDHPILQTDILVTTTSGIHATPVAEFALALMLALTRRLSAIVRNQTNQAWPPDRWTYYMGGEIRGSTVGVVGYGSIGREVARLAQALGARVLAAKRTPARADEGYVEPGVGDRDGLIPERIYRPDELLAMMGACDHVIVTVPATPHTRGLIGERQLRAMRSGAFLINVARGEVISEQALLRALREGWIAGAALDVFEQEPLPRGHPLWDFPNVIISPHAAGATVRYEERATRLFVDNLRRYLKGQPLLNRVDRARGY